MSWIRWGSVVMCLGVLAGAFGAHGLKGVISEESQRVYQTAVFYHLIHGLALLAVGWLATVKPEERLVAMTGWWFVSGIILFSGSLYLLSLTGIKKLGIITPVGGVAFLVGWVSLALAAR